MRDGTTQAVLDILAANGITTALLARLDFGSETICIWTGAHPITVQGTGDSYLDGKTFEPLASGVAISIGDNSYSYSGADAMTITLGIPASQSVSIAASQVTSDEYRGRPATLWRSLLVMPVDPLAEPTWIFRRVRAGAMDKLEITNDGLSHQFTLTIEAHASLISNATGSTYLDQKTRFDPTDTSQDYAASIGNPAPTSGSTIGTGSAGGGSDGRYNSAINIA